MSKLNIYILWKLISISKYINWILFVKLSLACGFALAGPISAGASIRQEKCTSEVQERNMREYESLQLGGGAIGLLKKLREIHEKFFMLFPSFISDENINNMFGNGEIVRIDVQDDSVTAKKMLSKDVSDSLAVNFIFWSASRFEKGRIIKNGWINISANSRENDYKSYFVEKYLVPNVLGKDLLREQVLNSLDIHAHASYHKRL
ncbi:hypothetical protein [Herbaspirillum camelliae]|uniref:hypothetical protein n=1 Tax=Herbaspirillum camelliae TaxID=1892903 RepID=UPI000AB66712|nr:hypothetical protein [Herbaspirillum camelliae]